MPTINLSVFVTSRTVIEYARTPESRAKLIADIKDVGATKVFLEVWRGGRQASDDALRSLRDACVDAGLAVATGIKRKLSRVNRASNQYFEQLVSQTASRPETRS